MKSKLLHIWYDMRHQPVIAWVTLIATALSIFLIMVVLIMQRVTVIPYSPESCRDRLLVGSFIHIQGLDGTEDSSGSLSYDAAKQLYDGLDGVERISFMQQWSDRVEIKQIRGKASEGLSRRVDGEFFNIFDHKILKGRVFTPQEANALQKYAVLADHVARELFGDQECLGATILVNQKPYTVIGVVADHSGLAKTAAGDVFIPTAQDDPELWNDRWWGSIYVALLMKEGANENDIRNQVKARYADLDTQLKNENRRTVYHESPFNQETIAAGIYGSNVTPDATSARHTRYAIYFILLLVPAINLSSMLHSRMRRRVNEIGVRRAFGCTRSRIISDIITENFLVTLAGGIIGVALGVFFATSFSSLYETMDNFGSSPTPSLSATLNWGTILLAVGVCFILNIISASIPAWQASRLNPVEAINTK